jgi:adenosylcobinamide kinase/adenosylcobinamide-phosphate guanylyltransferase
MKRIVLVLGGARSGKSAYAENLAVRHKGPKFYIATAEAFDEEMHDRIKHHRSNRAEDGWETIEAPFDLANAIRDHASKKSFILLDCITVWIGNLLHKQSAVYPQVDELCSALAAAQGTIIIVSNETGLGIVPDNPMARAFRDEAGRANQAIAKIAGEVVFVVAGLPLTLKTAKRKPGKSRRATSSRGRKA